MKTIAHRYSQLGAAALFVALILLFTATLVVLFAGKVGIIDQRISGNDARAKQAFASAEAGVDSIAGRLLTGQVNYTNTLSYSNTSNLPIYTGSLYPDLTVRANGYADDYDHVNLYNSPSKAAVQQKFGYAQLFDAGPDAPVIVAGNVPPQGNMEIIGNPNGGGSGVDIAVWTNATVPIDGSATTCQRAEYEANASTSYPPTLASTGDFNICKASSCGCSGTLNGIISQAGVSGKDIVYDDPATPSIDESNFPDDVFAYTFGIPKSSYTTIEAKATPLTDCSSLNSTSNGMYWVNGDCDLSGKDVGGANSCTSSGYKNLCTVVLIIGDGYDLRKTGSDNQFYGLIYMFDKPETADIGRSQLTGDASIYGAFVADHDVCGGASNCFSGHIDIVYERKVFLAIVGNKSNQLLTRVAGTWIDQ